MTRGSYNSAIFSFPGFSLEFSNWVELENCWLSFKKAQNVDDLKAKMVKLKVLKMHSGYLPVLPFRFKG